MSKQTHTVEAELSRCQDSTAGLDDIEFADDAVDEGLNVVSVRARHTLSYKDVLGSYFSHVSQNKFHPSLNPKGIVNMGTAVNRLMEEELTARVMKGDALRHTADHQHYYNLSGTQELRTSIANFLSRHLCPDKPLQPDNVVVFSGVAACMDALGHALCDPGDVMVTPTPVYGRIFVNFSDRAGCVALPLVLTEQCDPEGQTFGLSAKALETRFQTLKAQGRPAKIFVLLNPNNPLGEVYSLQVLRDLLNVCARYKVHFIVDEIYALSVYDPQAGFHSILAMEDLPDPQRTHVMWGLSKDFGLAGFRVGVVHTLNARVANCIRALATYQCASKLMQHAATVLLNDTEWCEEIYLPTNTTRLREAHEKVSVRLELMGVPVRKATAGFFLWVNMKAFLPEPTTHQHEKELWNELFEAGLFIYPGLELFCGDPGWFRIVFALTKEDLDEGLARLEIVLKARSRSAS